MTRGILHVNYIGIIFALSIGLFVQQLKVYELERMSIHTSIECVKILDKDIDKDKLNYCRPVMEAMGFKFNPEIHGS
tara:strand:- start:823 stop:1053 length:231 start_codon:yes stop_codon:yes gene_type:complete